MEKKFEWTDELVSKLLFDWLKNPFTRTRQQAREQIEDFKKEQSKPFDTVDSLHDHINRVSRFIDAVFVKKPDEKKYPEGIFEFKHSLPYDDWCVLRLFHECDYQKWCDVHIKVGRKIQKVKNSSGEILEAGMETDWGKIIRFEIKEDKICAWFDIPRGEVVIGEFGKDINVVHPKPAEPKFKTEDGFEMKHGEPMYMTYAPDYKILDILHDQGEWMSRGELGGAHCFRLKENAEKFVEENKPRFSKKQIEDATMVDTGYKHMKIIDTQKLGLT